MILRRVGGIGRKLYAISKDILQPEFPIKIQI